MAWYTRYRCEFNDDAGLTWKWDFEKTSLLALAITWSNYNNEYDTFITSGFNITSAIQTDDNDYGTGKSNTFVVTKGSTINISATLTLNSGVAPYIYIRDAFGVNSNIVTLSAGANTIVLTATRTNLAAFLIIETSDLTNYSVSGTLSMMNQMQAAGSPMTYEAMSDSDDLFEAPVRGIKADLRVQSVSLFQYKEFFTISPMEMRVSISAGSNLYFRGYVQPGSYTEPYNDYPYEVTISATCGLGYLRKLKFEESEGVYYNGRTSESQIICNILNKIGVTGFSEAVNIYEANMADGDGDSPIEQLKIDVDVFRDKFCYEVLEEILKKWSALIRQKDGEFYIYRPLEMVGLTYLRIFTDFETKTADTITAVQEINRSASSSDFLDTNGGALSLIPTARKIIINQDYGNKESWIDNWELKAETFDGTDFEGWTQYNGEFAKPISNYVPDEESGVAIIDLQLSPLYKFEQIFATSVIGSIDDMLTIEFDYGFFNTTTSDKTTLQTGLIVKQGSNYLTALNDSQCWWTTVPSNLDLTGLTGVVGWSGWTNYKRQIVPAAFPNNDPVTINLIGSAPFYDCYNCYRNIKFKVSSYEILAKKSIYKGIQRDRPSVLSNKWNQNVFFQKSLKEVKEKQYEITAGTTGEEVNIDCILGDVPQNEVGMDNIMEQFAGALSYNEITDPHDFKMCLIRNEEMNNSLSIASSTLLTITDKTGQVLTIDTLPNNPDFDKNDWVAMLCDEDKTTTSDPTPTGDYSYKNFCTIDRIAKTLTMPDGYSLTAWEVGDNLVLYNAFMNYSFVGDQTVNPIVSLSGAPAWRSMMTGAGPMFRHSDGRFIMLFIGFQASPTRGNIGYVSSTDMITWTIGNSDNYVYAATNFPLCTSVNLTGNCYPVEGSPGDYWCLVFYGRTSDGHGVQRIFYFDEDFTTFSYSDPIMSDTDLGFGGGSILKIGSTYHLIYMLITAAGIDYRSINAASSNDLEGPYTNYQTNIVRGIDANDGMAWSYATDAPCIFDDGTNVFGLFGAQAQYSESGTKGNRQYCLLNRDSGSGVWSASTKGPAFLNPLYYQDIISAYTWAGDHCGGYPCIFIEGNDVYVSLTMKGSAYQIALIKLNNIGSEYPTELWARKGVTESKNLLQIVGEEIALQRGVQRQSLQNYPIYDKSDSDNAPHLNVLGIFTDDLNEESVGVPKKLAFNRGVYDVKNRLWDCDLIELIE